MFSKMKKKCNKCGGLKNSSELKRNRHGNPGSVCKKCHAEGAKIRNRKNPRYPLVKRMRHLSKYGISEEEYDTMLKKQGGVCALCRIATGADSRTYSMRKNRRLCVDHDHQTGKIRGLLCSKCNFLLGLCSESLVLFQRAVCYLREHRKSRISRDEMMAGIAHFVASRGTCPRARVGAVIALNSRIISLGYNGALEGEPHCEDIGCIIVNNHCIRAVHAEQNAIAYAARQGISLNGATIYITYPICPHCEKIVKASGIVKVIQV